MINVIWQICLIHSQSSVFMLRKLKTKTHIESTKEKIKENNKRAHYKNDAQMKSIHWRF